MSKLTNVAFLRCWRYFGVYWQTRCFFQTKHYVYHHLLIGFDCYGYDDSAAIECSTVNLLARVKLRLFLQSAMVHLLGYSLYFIFRLKKFYLKKKNKKAYGLLRSNKNKTTNNNKTAKLKQRIKKKIPKSKFQQNYFILCFIPSKNWV